MEVVEDVEEEENRVRMTIDDRYDDGNQMRNRESKLSGANL